MSAEPREESREVQVLIVGLGPAGAACGMALAGSSLEVLALDRAHFPRDKICGDALPLAAQTLVQRLGLPTTAPELQCRSSLEERGSVRARGYDQGLTGQGWLAERGAILSSTACLQTVRRRDLDHWLVERCRERQLPMEFGWQVESLKWDQAIQRWQVRGRIRTREGLPLKRFAVTTPVVVGCDGAASAIQRQSNPAQPRSLQALASRCYLTLHESQTSSAQAQPRSRLHYLWPGESTYAWAFAVPGGFNCGVAAMVNRHGDLPIRGRDLMERTRHWIHTLNHDLGHSAVEASHHNTPTIQTMAIPVIYPSTPPQSSAGILLAGDAAALVDPHQGHGIDRALESGALAASVIRQGLAMGLAPAALSKRYQQRLSVRVRGWQQQWQALELESMNDTTLIKALSRPR